MKVRVARFVALAFLLMVLGPGREAVQAGSGGVTVRVSEAGDSTEGNSRSLDPAVSADGRFVAFSSWADNLVAGDTNGGADVFLRDRDADENGVFDEAGGVSTTRVSVTAGGGESDGVSYNPALSADGRYVAFESAATNLPGDTDFTYDVFVRDTVAGTTILVSVNDAGVDANHHSRNPSLSADGRYVAFDSWADNLVTPDTNGWPDVFLHDRDADEDGVFDEPGATTTTRISNTPAGDAPNARSQFPALSADGSSVAYTSEATDIVSGDTNGAYDVFVYDVQSGQTVRASVAGDGAEADGDSGDFNNYQVDVSDDGRLVTFSSQATNLVSGDGNEAEDVFVRDRDTDEDGVYDEPGAVATSRVSVASDGSEADSASTYPALSADGRYVAFQSYASNLVDLADNAVWDIYVHDRATGETFLASIATEGWRTNFSSALPAISADGAHVAFHSDATNLVGLVGDSNGVEDVFVHVPDAGPAPPPDPIDWQIETLDVQGNVGQYADVALDSRGYPHVSYYEKHTITGLLKYARWDGVVWRVQEVDAPPGGNTGLYTAITLDGSDRPHIVYQEQDTRDLKYARLVGTEWEIETVVGGPVDVGRPADVVVGNKVHITFLDVTEGELKHARLEPYGWAIRTIGESSLLGGRHSLALDPAGVPHVTFYSNGNLLLGRWDGAGDGWSIEPIDTGGNVGRDSALAFDRSGQPHVSYHQNGSELRYATFDGSAWVLETVDDNTGGAGPYNSIALDGADRPHIAYFDQSYRYLKYARRYGDGEWALETIEQPDVGRHAALALGQDDVPHVVYYDERYDDLKYASGQEPWQFRTVIDSGVNTWPSLALRRGIPAVSYNRAIPIPPSAAFGPWTGDDWGSEAVDVVTNGDYGTALQYDGAGRPHVVYYSEGSRELRHAQWDGSQWQVDVVHALQTGETMVATPRFLLLPPEEIPAVAYAYGDGSSVSVAVATRENGTWTRDAAPLVGLTVLPPAFDAGAFSTGRVGIALYNPSQALIQAVEWDDGAWTTSVVAQNVTVGDLAVAVDRRTIPDGVADTMTVAFHDDGTNQLRYAHLDGAWQVETAANGVNAVSGLDLAHSAGSWWRPRIAAIFGGGSVHLAGKDEPDGAWTEEEVVAADGTNRAQVSLAYDERERLAFREDRDGESVIVHAFRTRNEVAAPAQTQVESVGMGALQNGGCVCFVFGMSPEVCGAAVQAPAGVRPSLANDDMSDGAVLQAMTDLFMSSDEGAAFVNLYLQHDFEIGTLMVQDPLLLWDGYRTWHNFIPGLRALVQGRGAQVTITQEMADQALDVWQRLAAVAGPELAMEIDDRLAATNNLQEYVGMSFDDWARSMGVEPPSNRVFLPAVMSE